MCYECLALMSVFDTLILRCQLKKCVPEYFLKLSFIINFALYCVEEVLDWEDENNLSKEFWLSIKGSLKEKVIFLVQRLF